MEYEEAKKHDAYAIQNMGYDVGDTCRLCLDHYGRPCCNDEEDGGTGECCMLDDLHQMLVATADAGKGE